MYYLTGIIIFSIYMTVFINQIFGKNDRQYIRKNKTLINDVVKNEIIKYDKYDNNDDSYALYSDNNVVIFKEDYKCKLTEFIYGLNNIEAYQYYYNGNLKKVSSYKLGNYSKNGIFSYIYHQYGTEYSYYKNGNLKKIKTFEINELEQYIYLKTYLFYHNNMVYDRINNVNYTNNIIY